MNKNDQDVVMVKIPNSSSFVHLIRVGLTTLLRIHRISSDDLETFTNSLQKGVDELSRSGRDIVAHYKIDEGQIVIDLQCGRKKLQFSSSFS
tara:strand:+ start:554 stop:829 length:276 start_codon:yes stop_codon:yes gene_type:complete